MLSLFSVRITLFVGKFRLVLIWLAIRKWKRICYTDAVIWWYWLSMVVNIGVSCACSMAVFAYA